MNNKEQFENLSECHMYLAIQRKKDGAACKKVYRQIIYDEERDLDIILAKIQDTPGIWRIYHTVNKRDMVKALKKFKHTLIDTDKTSIESMWREELLQPENRAERKFMIDLDDIFLKEKIRYWLIEQGISFEIHKSPNGLHIVTQPFNRKLFAEDFPDVDVLVDGYYHKTTIFVDDDIYEELWKDVSEKPWAKRLKKKNNKIRIKWTQDEV